jgi:pimeloyl-ACP methyl ester carboxylesterase
MKHSERAGKQHGNDHRQAGCDDKQNAENQYRRGDSLLDAQQFHAGHAKHAADRHHQDEGEGDRPQRAASQAEAGIVAPYSDEQGKISIIRNASALNTNHTTMLVARHGEIQAPTLCLWGVHDPWQTIRDGERLAREIPDARLVRVETASHWIPARHARNFCRGSAPLSCLSSRPRLSKTRPANCDGRVDVFRSHWFHFAGALQL